MKYSVITLGCKVNQYESQQMSEQLERLGYIPVQKDEPADVYIINSCAVTATAEQKSRQAVHKARRTNPNAVVCLSGCISQAFAIKYDNFTDADIIIGNSNREILPSLIEEFMRNRQPIRAVAPHTPQSGLCGGIDDSFEGRTRAYMKIEDGCNRFCSYCIIPYARGRVRSRNLEDIVCEAEKLAGNYKEIVLTGINLSAFGQDTGHTLADAVHAVASVEGIERVRLGSLEADFLNRNILAAFAAEPKFCPQFHLSLQSGCDKTLKRMNRHYTSADYAQLVAGIRELFNNPSITTDVIVGFPGETDSDFIESLEFVKQVGFTRIHCFIFSPRKGTAAYTMPDQVPTAVKNERAALLQAAAAEAADKSMHSQLGIEQEIVAERIVCDNIWEGYTRNYTAVHFTGDCKRGGIYTVVADTVCGDHCIGHIVE